MKLSPYEPRPIRFLELWEPLGWQIKVYGIAANRPQPRPELIQAAKLVAEKHLATAAGHYGVGFLGVHDGRTANFVFIDWWAAENELHHHVYVSPTGQPSQFTYATPSGLTACVWDLALMGFERDAWVDCVLKPESPDLNAYLDRRMSHEV